MIDIRIVAFGAFLAVGLTGCGSTLADVAVVSPSPTTSAAPTCPAVTSNVRTPSTAFCLTAQEVALGEVPIDKTTIPESVFILTGHSYTTPPPGSPAPPITEQQAEAIALAAASPPLSNPRVRAVELVESHSVWGTPARGHLVWLVDVSPPGGAVPPVGQPAGDTSPAMPALYWWTTVDAQTGALGMFLWG